jgi:hypothetical protein
MDYDKIRKRIIDIIADIAVDEDLSNIDDNIRLREQLDLDSMDFLDIVMEMNNPAASSGVSKGTCAPRGGELDPHLSRSASPRG